MILKAVDDPAVVIIDLIRSIASCPLIKQIMRITSHIKPYSIRPIPEDIVWSHRDFIIGILPTPYATEPSRHVMQRNTSIRVIDDT